MPVPRAGQYQIIYADPPWFYNDRKCGSSKFGLGSVGTYGCLPAERISWIPVQDWAAPNCALFLWATWPNLPAALHVMRMWGFEYKTLGWNWVKTNKNSGTPFFGTGFYSKSNTEPCLLGIRGKMTPETNAISQIIEAEEMFVHPARTGRHSEKPAMVRDRIVELFGDLPRLEMFARERAPGWDSWGNEINPLDALDVPTEESLRERVPF